MEYQRTKSNGKQQMISKIRFLLNKQRPCNTLSF